MNGKVYVGQKALSLTEYEKTAPISGVILWVDDENCYEAGDETGTVIEQDCPYATQEMANNLLATLQGYSYQGLEANGAKVSPVAELGDGLTIGGLYTQLAYQNIRFSTGEVMDVSAPGSNETLHEYKTEGETTKQFNHQIAKTRSIISKTSEEILLQVENELEGLSSSFSVQLDNITSRVNGLDGEFAELSLTLDGLTVTDPSGQTIIDGSKIQTSNLYVNAANISGTLTIGQLPSSVAQTSDIPDKTSDLINDSGFQTALGVTQIVNGTITTDYVNALEITAGSVSASNVTAGVLQAASISVEGLLTLQYGGVAYGLVGASSAGNTSGAVLTDSTATNYFIATRSGARMSAANEAQIYVSNGGCYCSSEMQVFSDRSLKNTITYGLEKYEKVFENLRPCFYKLNSDGEGAKFRIGLIAQDIKDTLKESGLSEGDLALLGNSESLCTIGYGEIIPLNTWKIQQLEKRVKELEANLIG